MTWSKDKDDRATNDDRGQQRAPPARRRLSATGSGEGLLGTISTLNPMLLASLTACVLVLLNNFCMLTWRTHDQRSCRNNSTRLQLNLEALQAQATTLVTECEQLHGGLKVYEEDVWSADSEAQALHKDLKTLTAKMSKMRRQNLLVANTGDERDGAATSAVARMDSLLVQLGESLDAANSLLNAEDETSSVFKKLAVWVAGSGLGF